MLSTIVRISYFIICVLVSWMPWAVYNPVARFISAIWYYVVPVRKKLILENLRLAFPEKSEKEIHRITRENLVHYVLLAIECFKLRFMSRKKFLEYVEAFRNPGPAYRAAKEGNGFLFLTAHIGNFEGLSYGSTLFGLPSVHIVVRPLHVRAVEKVVQATRSRWINVVFSKNAFKSSLKLIREKQVVGVILDQHAGHEGAIWVDFFGRPAGTMKYLAVLADRTGVPVIPVKLVRRPDGRFIVDFEEPIEYEKVGSFKENVIHNTQRYTKRIEAWVRETPEQWFWIHRRWKKPPENVKGAVCSQSKRVSSSAPSSSSGAQLPPEKNRNHHPQP